MNELALFAGAGGGLLAGHLLGWTTVCAVEKEPYRREVLMRRQRDGVFPVFPIWDDCGTFDGRPWRGLVDVVSAGFPCQPFSVAGKRQGADDSRNGWPDTIRIIREVRPRYAFLENVPGLLSSGYFGRVLGDLAEAGYDAVWTVLGADDVGAPHRRKRLWILAYAAGRMSGEQKAGDRREGARGGGEAAYPAGFGEMRLPIRPGGPQQATADVAGAGQGGRIRWWDIDPAELPDALSEPPDRCGHGTGEVRGQRPPETELPGSEATDVPDTQEQPERAGLRKDEQGGERRGRSGDTDCEGVVSDPERQGLALGEGQRRDTFSQLPSAQRGNSQGNTWPIESRVGRVAHGISHRIQRLAALGDGQVPAVAAAAWAMLIQQLEEMDQC